METDSVLVDGRQVQEMRDAGMTWSGIAVELAVSVQHAQRLANHYVAHCDAVAAKEQLPLFTLDDIV